MQACKHRKVVSSSCNPCRHHLYIKYAAVPEYSVNQELYSSIELGIVVLLRTGIMVEDLKQVETKQSSKDLFKLSGRTRASCSQ